MVVIQEKVERIAYTRCVKLSVKCIIIYTIVLCAIRMSAFVKLDLVHDDNITATKENHLPDSLQYATIAGEIASWKSIGSPILDCGQVDGACFFEYLCLRNRKNQRGHINVVSKDPTLQYQNIDIFIKGERTVFDVESTTPNEEEIVQLVKGFTHFHWLRHGNLLLNLLIILGLRQVIEQSRNMYPTHEGPSRLVTLVTPRRAFRYPKSNIWKMYQSLTPEHSRFSILPYDWQSSFVKTSDIVCFERGTIGWETLSGPITGPQNSHLDDVVLSKEVTNNEKWINVHNKLYDVLPDFKEELLRNLGVAHIVLQPKRVLLITREDVRGNTGKPQYRRILNQKDVIELLMDHGYDVDVIDFATVSIEEQMRRSRSAQIFIGMHGAGMTNAMWLHTDACVIELHTFGFQKYGYQSLMHYLRQCYMHWVNTHENASIPTWKSMQSEPNESDFWRDRDQIVNLTEFAAILDHIEVKIQERNEFSPL